MQRDGRDEKDLNIAHFLKAGAPVKVGMKFWGLYPTLVTCGKLGIWYLKGVGSSDPDKKI